MQCSEPCTTSKGSSYSPLPPDSQAATKAMPKDFLLPQLNIGNVNNVRNLLSGPLWTNTGDL